MPWTGVTHGAWAHHIPWAKFPLRPHLAGPNFRRASDDEWEPPSGPPLQRSEPSDGRDTVAISLSPSSSEVSSTYRGQRRREAGRSTGPETNEKGIHLTAFMRETSGRGLYSYRQPGTDIVRILGRILGRDTWTPCMQASLDVDVHRPRRRGMRPSRPALVLDGGCQMGRNDPKSMSSRDGL